MRGHDEVIFFIKTLKTSKKCRKPLKNVTNLQKMSQTSGQEDNHVGKFKFLNFSFKIIDIFDIIFKKVFKPP